MSRFSYKADTEEFYSLANFDLFALNMNPQAQFIVTNDDILYAMLYNPKRQFSINEIEKY